MENVGCVTLRDEYLFRSKVTAASTDYRRDTILHELSHMWFGDLVTMRWWDDLWLKESFATWASTFAVSENAEDPTLAWAAFAAARRPRPTARTSCPRPTRSRPTSSTWRRWSTTSTRSPTPRAPRCWSSWSSFVGRDAFLAGVRSLLRRATPTATPTLTDLLACLEKTSGRDLSDWSRQWLETAGVNTLRLEWRPTTPA